MRGPFRVGKWIDTQWTYSCTSEENLRPLFEKYYATGINKFIEVPSDLSIERPKDPRLNNLHGSSVPTDRNLTGNRQHYLVADPIVEYITIGLNVDFYDVINSKPLALPKKLSRRNVNKTPLSRPQT